MVDKKTGTPRKKKAAKKRRSVKRAGSKAEAPPPMHDRRSMEKMMLQMSRLLEEQEFETVEEANEYLQQFIGTKDLLQPSDIPLTPLDQAQEKIYEAWDARGKRRAKLAREALEISPDCADAYVLLAEETTHTPEEAKEFYEQGVRAGERALGHEIFEDAAGEFWGMLETRPYMRARAGLAEVLAAMNEKRQAIEHYKELLRLNPNDNQGNRYQLAHLLLQEGMDDELASLLLQYEGDAAAEWAYTRALWQFRREGASESAAEALHEAFTRNPHVPLYLIGVKKLPKHPPGYIGLGDENEAIAYIFEAIEDWVLTPGAPEWLTEIMLEELKQIEEGEEGEYDEDEDVEAIN
jgi:tetratricopeptide (TPR) repeat protein